MDGWMDGWMEPLRCVLYYLFVSECICVPWTDPNWLKSSIQLVVVGRFVGGKSISVVSRLKESSYVTPIPANKQTDRQASQTSRQAGSKATLRGASARQQQHTHTPDTPTCSQPGRQSYSPQRYTQTPKCRSMYRHQSEGVDETDRGLSPLPFSPSLPPSLYTYAASRQAGRQLNSLSLVGPSAAESIPSPRRDGDLRPLTHQGQGRQHREASEWTQARTASRQPNDRHQQLATIHGTATIAGECSSCPLSLSFPRARWPLLTPCTSRQSMPSPALPQVLERITY